MLSSDSAAFQAALHHAAVFSLPGRTQIEITGADRASFLHNFCTNHIKGLAVGQGCEAFLVNIKGRILFSVLVYAGPDSLWVETEVGQAAALLTHLDRYIITEDVQLVDRTQDLSQLYISGAGAESLVSKTVSVDWNSIPKPGQAVVNGVMIRRYSFGPVLGVSLVGSASEIAALYAQLLAAGAVDGPPELLEALRIEAGTPRSGIDLTEDHLAQEANRTKLAINFNKGCYLGQEPIARIDALGHVNRLLCGVITDEPAQLPAGIEVFAKADASAPSGTLTSTSVWPESGRAVGLGTIRRELAQEGAACFLGPTRIPAKVRVWPGRS